MANGTQETRKREREEEEEEREREKIVTGWRDH